MWADPLIRVNKYKEDDLKSQLAEIREQILYSQTELEKVTQLLEVERQQYEQNMCNQAVLPQAMSQFFTYTGKLQDDIQALAGQIQNLRKMEFGLIETLKAVAQKRILLEGIRERHMKEQNLKREKKEELLMEDLAQNQFIEERKK